MERLADDDEGVDERLESRGNAPIPHGGDEHVFIGAHRHFGNVVNGINFLPFHRTQLGDVQRSFLNFSHARTTSPSTVWNPSW
jgi:hypothetical protein